MKIIMVVGKMANFIICQIKDKLLTLTAYSILEQGKARDIIRNANFYVLSEFVK